MTSTSKRALVTGATGGIGCAIVKKLAAEGWQLVLAARSAPRLDALCAEIGAGATVHATDVSDEASVRALFNSTRAEFGSLDAVVIASGTYGEINKVEDADAGAWWDGVKTNLFGTMLCIKFATPLMKERGGSIVTFAGGGEGPYPHFSSYAASKGGTVRLTETAARELEPYRIRVNAVAPGAVNSSLVEKIIAVGRERAGDEAVRKAREQLENGGVPPEKAAALVSFLVSDASVGITGRVLSALHDRFTELPEHRDALAASDVYTWRRIKPKDRGYDW